MTLPWLLRFVASMCLLRAASVTAAWIRALRLGASPPALPACLPSADPDPEGRVRRVAEARAALRLVPVGEKFGLGEGFPHQTLAALPASERYPWPFRLPKALLAAALSVDLSSGAPPRPARTETWLGRPAVRRLGWDGASALPGLATQGPNPSWIRHAPELADRVPDLDVAPERLYAVDYRSVLAELPVRAGRVLTPCAALYEGGDGLRLLGVLLQSGAREFWVPEGAPLSDAARRHHRCAELHVHEAVSHFLWTHVYGEKFVIATLRHLDEGHPVRRLLAPHFTATLQANENSGSRLLGTDGLFGRCFSAGWVGVAELLRRGDHLWRFDQMVFPEALRQRGVAELRPYPYAEDGMALWSALSDYVDGVVLAWYPEDEAIARDGELRAWSDELQGWMGARGLPRVESHAALSLVLTAVLFNVVQHSFVNALQYDAFGAPDLWPAALSAAFDAPEDGLPVGVEALDAVRATFGFSIQYNSLGDGLLRWHGPATRPVAERFLSRLRDIEGQIAARTPARPWPYSVALPARVSNSINA